MKNIFSTVKFTLLLNSIILVIQNYISFERLLSPFDKIVPLFITISGVIGIVILILFKYLWKIPGLNTILSHFFNCNINLQGTWFGILNSNYEGVDNRVVFLVISQKDAFTINCNLITENRISISKTADILKENAIAQLVYTYEAKEDKNNDIEGNPMHIGFAQMIINEKRAQMKGFYFTNNETRGTIQFSKLSWRTYSLYEEAKKYLEKKNLQWYR